MPKKQQLPDWQQALLELDNTLFTRVKIKADGHVVTFTNEISRRRVFTCWFVDGEWKAAWIDKESDMGKKFGYPMIRKVPAKLLRLKKLLREKITDKTILLGYQHYYPSSRAIIDKLNKTCTEIELIKDDG